MTKLLEWRHDALVRHGADDGGGDFRGAVAARRAAQPLPPAAMSRSTATSSTRSTRPRRRPDRRAEAEAARVEVSRRLLAAADAAERRRSRQPVSPTRRRAAALAALVLLPLGAGASLSHARLARPAGAAAAGRAGATADRRNALPACSRSRRISSTIPEDGRGWEVVGAGLYAARPLRRRGEGAAQCAAAARPDAPSAKPISARR